MNYKPQKLKKKKKAHRIITNQRWKSTQKPFVFVSFSPYRERVLSTLDRVIDIKPNGIGWIHRDEPPTLRQVAIVIRIIRGSDLPFQSCPVFAAVSVD